ncbi:MAG: VanZ family protein [Candidatus Coatesbacteria bacterium]|nr:VanZ family protein [Candidatus Coatesbacteria bacterium]
MKKAILNWIPFLLLSIIVFSTTNYIPIFWEPLYAKYGNELLVRIVQLIISFILAAAAVSVIINSSPAKRMKTSILGFLLLFFYVLPLYYMKNAAERFHFVEYGLWFLFAVKGFQGKTVHAFILTSIMGILDELYQWYLPSRFGEIADVVLNIYSISLSWLGLKLYRYGRS